MWLEVDGFNDLVKSFRGELQVSGSRSFILAKKLNFLKHKLKEWNRDVFGHLDSKMAVLVDKLSLLMRKSNSYPFL